HRSFWERDMANVGGRGIDTPAGEPFALPKVPGASLFAAVPWLARWQSVAVLYAILALAASWQFLAGRGLANFDIFRHSFLHLINGQDLYVRYPDEHTDYFLYSPPFALFMAPLWVLPTWVALPGWALLNAFAPFWAVRRLAISESAK